MRTSFLDLSTIAFVCIAMVIAAGLTHALIRTLLRLRVGRLGEVGKRDFQWLTEVLPRTVSTLVPLFLIYGLLFGLLYSWGVPIRALRLEPPCAEELGACDQPYPKDGVLEVEVGAQETDWSRDEVMCGSRYGVAFWVETNGTRYPAYSEHGRVVTVERQPVSILLAAKTALLIPARLVSDTCLFGLHACGGVRGAQRAGRPLDAIFYTTQPWWLPEAPHPELSRRLGAEERYEGCFYRLAIVAVAFWPGFIVVNALELLGLWAFTHSATQKPGPVRHDAGLARDLQVARLRMSMTLLLVAVTIVDLEALVTSTQSPIQAVPFCLMGWLLVACSIVVWKAAKSLYGEWAALVFTVAALLPGVRIPVLAFLMLAARQYLLSHRFVLGWLLAAPPEAASVSEVPTTRP